MMQVHHQLVHYRVTEVKDETSFEALKGLVQVVDARLSPTLRTERRSSVFCCEGLWSSNMSTQ